MDKYVIISTNENPDYFFYIPVTCWAWKKLGWNTAVFLTHTLDVKKLDECCNEVVNIYCEIPNVKGVRSSTLAQVGRHFSFHLMPRDSYILLSDIDMIPLSNYIQPDFNKKTIWGWDLTGYGFVPVSYIGMKCEYWENLMSDGGTMQQDMEKDMKKNGRAYMEKWEDYWDADWDILTQKVLPRKNEFTFIDRGFVHLAKNQVATASGRIDRYDIDNTFEQKTFIDYHADNNNSSHPEKWKMIKRAMEKTLGELPEWMNQYVKKHFEKYGIK